MKCKRNIPCPMGGMICCLGCPVRKCKEKCAHKFKCFMSRYVPAIKRALAITTFLILILIAFQLCNLEKEHNAIVDKLDQVDNHITEQLNDKFPAEEFTDSEIAIDTESSEPIGTFEVTYYCAGFGEGCPICGTDGITANGTKCSPLGNDWVTIAVDPRIIPYGTKLKIVIGDDVIYGIAEDTGAFAEGLYPVKQIDICTSNHE